MGRQRTQPRAPSETQLPPRDEEIAAAIAAILGGALAVASLDAAIAVLLGAVVMPFGLPDLQTTEIAEAGARIAATDAPAPPSGATLDNPIGQMHIENLIRRAQYAIKASRRMARRVGAGSSVREAILAERPLYRSHREAERERLRSSEEAQRHLERYGRIGTWIHGNPREPRPNHLAADGKQFDILNPPASVGGVLPGVLPGCTCSIGAPREGARRLI